MNLNTGNKVYKVSAGPRHVGTSHQLSIACLLYSTGLLVNMWLIVNR